MRCEQCRDREATVHIERVTGGRKTQLDLCPVCAREYYRKIGGARVPSWNGTKVLQAILAHPEQFGVRLEPGLEEKVCPDCQTTGRMLRKSGLTGCGSCYGVFAREIDAMTAQLQKGPEHRGRVPEAMLDRVGARRQIRQMRQDLRDCVEREDYEEAAKLRDAIRQLEEVHGAEEGTAG